MKKILLSFLLLTLLISSAVHAQSFDKGTVVISAGYGVPNLIAAPFRVVYKIAKYTDVSFSSMGPVLARGEYGLSKSIGIGFAAGYSTMNVGYTFRDVDVTQTKEIDYHAKITWTSPSAGLRFNFHFANSEKKDLYFGLGGGWSGNKLSYSDDSPWEDKYPKPGISTFHFNIGLGFRYYFVPNFGAYMEIGWDKASLVQGGILLRFKTGK